MSPKSEAGLPPRDDRFHTTRWNLIASSREDEAGEKGNEALAQLCRVYWRPIFAFICRQGNDVTDAQDLTQEFFFRFLKGNLLEKADEERGRFRSFLLRSLQNFLHDAHDRERADKRGGEIKFISWDDWRAEAPSHLRISPGALESWGAERIFDVRWAATIAERALLRLQEECERRGRRRVFDALSLTLTAERSDISYGTLAKELGVTTIDIKGLLQQLRIRFRKFLREEVAQTVEHSNEIDDELRYLVAALAAGRAATASSP